MSSGNQLLHHQYIKSCSHTADLKPTLVFIHGLFGAGSNLKLLANAFANEFNILLLDLRNHGLSFHNQTHTYDTMAQDVVMLLDALEIEHVVIIGHSMGGKVAMKLPQYLDQRVQKLVILDIAPVAYEVRRHDEIFEALNLVKSNQITKRPEASQILQANNLPDAIAQFLLKSFVNGQWQFNLSALQDNYLNILTWEEVSAVTCDTLFIIGADSDYVLPSYRQSILKQFPKSKAHIVNGAEHWVHADKPEQVIRSINAFLN